MPKQLEQNVLYVSKEFGTAAHLCACGCGCKIRTPLKPTEWTFTDSKNGPTLKPSIGNWQLPCKSHYWITDGEILWSSQWTNKQIIAGRNSEESRRRAYFERINKGNVSLISKIYNWIRDLFN